MASFAVADGGETKRDHYACSAGMAKLCRAGQSNAISCKLLATPDLWLGPGRQVAGRAKPKTIIDFEGERVDGSSKAKNFDRARRKLGYR